MYNANRATEQANNPQAPLTPTAWRDASPADRVANAMTPQEFAAAEHKWRMFANTLMEGLARLCRSKKVVLASDVWTFVADTYAATVSKDGVSTLGASRVAKVVGCHADTVTRARHRLAKDGLTIHETGANTSRTTPVISRLQQIADADFHDIFDDWAPRAKVGRPSGDNSCGIKNTPAHMNAGATENTPALDEKYPRSLSSMSGLNPGFPRDRSFKEEAKKEEGERECDRELIIQPQRQEEGAPIDSPLPLDGSKAGSAAVDDLDRRAAAAMEILLGRRDDVLGGLYGLEGIAKRLRPHARRMDVEKLRAALTLAADRLEGRCDSRDHRVRRGYLLNGIDKAAEEIASGGEKPVAAARSGSRMIRKDDAGRERFGHSHVLVKIGSRRSDQLWVHGINVDRAFDEVPDATVATVNAAVQYVAGMYDLQPGEDTLSALWKRPPSMSVFVGKVVARLRGETVTTPVQDADRAAVEKRRRQEAELAHALDAAERETQEKAAEEEDTRRRQVAAERAMIRLSMPMAVWNRLDDDEFKRHMDEELRLMGDEERTNAQSK